MQAKAMKDRQPDAAPYNLMGLGRYNEVQEPAPTSGGSCWKRDSGDLTVLATRRDGYVLMDIAMGHPYKCFFPELQPGDPMRQLVVYRGEWLAAISWAVSSVRSLHRDQGTGGQAGTPFETRYNVARIRAFILRPLLESGWESIALSAALRHLPDQMLREFRFKPMLAEVQMHPSASNAQYFTETGWHLAAMEDDHTSCWLKELAPNSGIDFANYILAKCIDDGNLGRLPIPCSCLESLKDALQAVRDPRLGRTKYQLGSLLSLAFLAAMHGAWKTEKIVECSRRLRPEQACSLGLPPAANAMDVHGPGPGTYSGLRRLVDIDSVNLILKHWLHEHLDELPGLMAPDTPFMVETLEALTRMFRPASASSGKPKYRASARRKSVLNRKRATK
jgi:hypothetical protein